jgi:polyphosphate kinase
VGRFLEHSRIFYFENGGVPEIYLGSADWMPRNLYERVEVLFPLKDEALRERICKEILPPYLADNRKARVLGADGQYTHLRRSRNAKTVSVQEHLMNLARGFVNGRPGGLHSGITHTKSEQAIAPSPAGQIVEPETQDSANATV